MKRSAETAVEFAEALAAELRAGRGPATALREAAEQLPAGEVATATRTVAATASVGGDVPAALRAAADLPGLRSLAWIAAAWAVAHERGSSLADAVDRIAAAARAEQRHAAEVSAQLAGPRATARLLTGLPVVGILMGSVLGARPVHVLVGSPLGWCCLAAGSGLTVLGWRWTERLARAAERPA
jgi:tight adherence protein B